jgi:hypothetical protein
MVQGGYREGKGCDNNNNNNNNIIVEPEMYDYTSSIWSHWNSNEKLKEKSVSYTG